MPTILHMPKIGVNMTEGTIVNWVAKIGDALEKGDHILDAETDKAIQEIITTKSGQLAKILVKIGDVVACQKPIAVLTKPGEILPEGFQLSREISSGQKFEENQSIAAGIFPQETERTLHQKLQKKGKQRVSISPLAKKIAKEKGIDFRLIKPEKEGGRITKKMVLAFLSPTLSPLKQTSMGLSVSGRLPYSGMRKTIGERMAMSASTIPSVTLSLSIDADILDQWKKEAGEFGQKVSYNDLMVKVVAKALKNHPIMNSRLVGDEIQLLENINIGVAVDTEKGLIVPVVKEADKKGVFEIAQEFRNKVLQAKSGNIGADTLSDGTFTITNLGMCEIELFTPIINPPECAILALGNLRKEPIVNGDKIEIRRRLQLCLTFDHRIVDGAPAGRFLQEIKHLLEKPLMIMN